MDAREERGRLLSLDRRIKRAEGDVWYVPSQSGGKGYLVDALAASCTCADYELRRGRCKHQWAVQFSQEAEQEVRAGGDPPTEPATKAKKKTYRQDWRRYNAAQCSEKALVRVMLRGLCDGIRPPQARRGRGRPPLLLSDAVYGTVLKVYTTLSGRRASTDLRECAAAGRMSRAPHYNSVHNYMEDPAVTPILRALIEESAAPLSVVETRFAVDSTGFGTSVYRRWFDHKYGREVKQQTWLKAHAMVGVATNVVTAVSVTDGDGADSPEAPGLIEATRRRFTIEEASLDKAYLSHSNLEAIEAAGAVPYIPFKSNSQGDGPAAWRRMWALFVYRQEEFLQHYHLRSNVESTFSAVKRLFGGAVRSRIFPAQVNEVLCKLLCYNLTCLVHAVHELGIDPVFGAVSP